MGEEIALFPLSNVVLFPRVRAPLHVFEPRYRQMVEHALASERRIGMATVLPEHVAVRAVNMARELESLSFSLTHLGFSGRRGTSFF